MPTFTFEAHYGDGNGGRCDIVNAPDRETAIRIAASSIIEDNSWDDGRLTQYASLTAFYEDEMVIYFESTDLNGTACPNCTSHDTKDSGGILAWTTGQVKVRECNTCGYEWAPLGKSKNLEPTAEELAELDAWEAERFSPTDEESQ